MASTALQQRTAVVPAVILLTFLLTTVQLSPLMMSTVYLSSIGSSGSSGSSSEQHPTWYADDIADRYRLALHALGELSEYKCAARSAALAKGLIAVTDAGARYVGNVF
jgi:hypothetical protein